MELQSLKAVLLRKSEGNNNLSTLIEYMGENSLAEHVLEALEKMADTTRRMGSGANGALSTYASELDDVDIAQLRDALGHHISHYKAALKQMHAQPSQLDAKGNETNKERLKWRQVADKHLNHGIPLMHLAGKAGKISGKLKLDYTELPAWETNYTTIDRLERTGKYKHDNEKLKRRISPNAEKWKPHGKEYDHTKCPDGRDGIARGVPDYRYLEMAPHHGHDHWHEMPHEGGYPWEEVQIGTPEEVDAKKAYIHIDDVEHGDDVKALPADKIYKPHAMDFHPVRSGRKFDGDQELHDIPGSYLSQGTLDKFHQDMSQWRESEHYNNWLAHHDELEQKDPEAYGKRHTVKAPHVYEGMPLPDQLGHVHMHKKEPKRSGMFTGGQAKSAAGAAAPPAAAPAAPKPAGPGLTIKRATPSAAPAPAAPSASPVAAPASSPAPSAAGKPHPMEAVHQDYLKATPDTQKLMSRLLASHPEYQAYLKTRPGGSK